MTPAVGRAAAEAVLLSQVGRGAEFASGRTASPFPVPEELNFL